VGNSDIRWQQRLANYQRALAQLQSAVELQTQRPLSELERQGLIQAFEFTHELAWNVMKDFFIWQGRGDMTGSRDATRAAFSVQLIEDGEGWMEMITSRNRAIDSYQPATAVALADCILRRHVDLLAAFAARMEQLAGPRID
jgi:nucleotidyltransferase substrate binding protein (TIGR01987 family)